MRNRPVFARKSIVMAVVLAALLTGRCLPADQFRSAAFAPADFHAAALLIVHYHRADNAYADWNLWAWPEGSEGHAVAFDRSDAFGKIAIVPFQQRPQRVGIIVRQGDWRAKDIDQDRYVAFEQDRSREIWLISGDPTVYDDASKIDLSVKLRGVFLDAKDEVTVAASGPLDESELRVADISARTETGRKYAVAAETKMPATGSEFVYELKLSPPVDARDIAALWLDMRHGSRERVYARQVLDDSDFVASNSTLGYQCNSQHTIFRTWSPVSSDVELLLYHDLKSGVPVRQIPMRRSAHGIWEADVAGDLEGAPYRYRFIRYGQSVTAADMHTFAASDDSAYSVVEDLDRLEPAAFDSTPAPVLASPTDELLYELHTRDFSIDDDECPPGFRGTYLGLVQSMPAQKRHPTRGLAHLKELGVTAVHLLPVEQYGGTAGAYNWGYWTSLFNVPESNYSTNPADPTRAIVELRQAVTTLHRNNIRVVMDVVYNHAAGAGPDSPFEAAVPYYYFRTTPAGQLINDTGVGNTLADEHRMVRKFIVDSLKHWVRDYHVDGFRFDLLGCEQPETVRAICNALTAIRPDITLYGEPWTGGGPVHFPKGAQRGMHIALFNDNFRNAIRGDLNGTITGFADGSGGDIAAIQRGIAGSIDDFTSAPTESINYVDCHDDLTFWDKLTLAHPNASEAEKKAMQKLAMGIVLTSQGIAFLHGGSEFCQTKRGNADSYNAGDAINAFDWSRKTQFEDVYEYVRGLVGIRKAHPAFRMREAQEVRSNLRFLDARPLVAFTIDGAACGDSWKRILVAYNGRTGAEQFQLPGGRWGIVVDEKSVETQPMREVAGQLRLPGESMVIACQ